MSDSYGCHIEAVARLCLGEPNKALSSANELRFGSNGSKSVDLAKGTFFDHEADEGGGVLDLLCRSGYAKDHGAAAKLLKDDFGAELPDERRTEPTTARQEIVATYDYVDEHGEVLFQVCRYGPQKTFRQRRPDGPGWSWKVQGVRQVPYNLPAVLKAPKGRAVFIAEGEKDVENLAAAGVLATCNAGGAGKWRPELSEHLAGRDVVILPDRDDAGQKHAALVASSLVGVAKRVRVLELPGLGPKQDPSDWLAAGGDKAQLVALAEATPDYEPATEPLHPVSAFGAIHWSELDQHETRADWLVEDLFFQGNAGMIYGEPGSGKSFLALHMGLCVARGVPFLGKRTEQGGVLYQAGEGGQGLVKRLKAHRLHHRIADPTIPFVLLPESVNLFDGDVEPFVAECEMQAAAMTVPLRVIAIDTFSTATTGANENDGADVGRVLSAGKRLHRSTGASIIWVHHKNAGGSRERGHTSLRGDLDFAIEVVRDADTTRRTATLDKLKDGDDTGVKLHFELQRVVLDMDGHGKEVSSCIVAPVEARIADTAKFKLAAGPVKYLRALEQAIARRGGQLPMIDGIPERQIGVEFKAFRDLYAAMHGGDREITAVRQAITRDGDKLVELGLVGRWEGYVWLTRKGELWL